MNKTGKFSRKHAPKNVDDSTVLPNRFAYGDALGGGPDAYTRKRGYYGKKGTGHEESSTFRFPGLDGFMGL